MSVAHLLSGGRLARNVLWNLAGQAAPVLVALAAIPILIRGLGTDRFGILTLAWVLIGYFSLFDFGLGRALTQLVARRIGHDPAENRALVWTALILMVALGLVGSAIVAAGSPWLIHRLLKIPAALQGEALTAFYLLSASIPLTITTTGLRGVLEAHQRFGLSNAVRIPQGIFTFLGPVAVLPFSRSLVAVVAVLVLGRVATWIAYLLASLRVMPVLRSGLQLDRRAVRPLVSFGGWMTISNVVGPIMVYLDRFLIGAMISVAAVAYYATPYEIVTKLWIVPSAITGVLFPAFATSFAHDRHRTSLIFSRGLKYLFLALFPLTLVIVTLAHDGLLAWLGPEFASRSTTVAQWLAIGVFANGLAQVPFALVQATGRPDWTAKLHLVEVPLYLAALFILVATFGITGAAIAWAVRASLDMLVLYAMAVRRVPGALVASARQGALVVACLLALLAGILISGLLFKLIFLALSLGTFAAVAWLRVLSPQERDFHRGLSLARAID